MGLDVVELVMAVEKEFDVRLPDSALSRMRTVGDLYAAVLSQLGGERGTACPTGRSFYHLRRVLTRDFGIARAVIRPAAPIAAVLPAVGRRAAWDRLAVALGGVRLPALDPLPFVSDYSPIAGLAAASVVLVLMSAAKVSLWIGILVFFAVWALSAWAFTRSGAFRTTLPRPRPRVRDVVLSLASQSPAALTLSSGPIPTDRVWGRLCDMIAEHLAVPREGLRPDTYFVEDLRVD